MVLASVYSSTYVFTTNEGDLAWELSQVKSGEYNKVGEYYCIPH